MRRVLLFLSLLLAFSLFGISLYIDKKVEKGRVSISDAKKKVGSIRSFFSLTPVTKPIGKAVTDNPDSLIKEGEERADQYALLARECKLASLFLLVISAIIIAWHKRS